VDIDENYRKIVEIEDNGT